MILVKKLLCLLGIHNPYFISFRFTDTVAHKAVNLYGCTWCNKTWLAHTHRSRFKIYKKGEIL